MKKALIIGSGFAGMSAACFLAKAGFEVTVLEKNAGPGGRAQQCFMEGFTFDMGPSWYWMPDVFEKFFNQFGKRVADYYVLKRLDPSYRVYWPESSMNIPAKYNALRELFEAKEPGSAKKLDAFLKEAQYKYDIGINRLVYKPGVSVTELIDADIIKGIFRMDVFTSMKKHVSRYFKNPQLQQLMEFPVLFLGATAQDIPALYSLMNYADMKLGTWYPEGGMYKIAEAMYSLAVSLGVKFQFNAGVIKINSEKRKATGVEAMLNTGQVRFDADVIVSGADMHFTEMNLLPPRLRTYSERYWNKKCMAPSCLIYYVGINKKLTNILHHSLFFDADFKVHGKEIYEKPVWPSHPLFYVSAVSVTDKASAPGGCENLFFLVPVAVGLEGDNETLREKYFEDIAQRFENRIGENIRSHIICKRSYSVSDFKNDYHSFKGNAYGLANTLRQTANLKPTCKSKKLDNLFYTGQLTVPGPGVPPCIISGEVVAGLVQQLFN